MSLFSVFLLLWHLGTSWHWRNWPSQGLPIPGDSKLACESTFHMQTNQLKSPYLDHLLYHTLGHYSPAPIPWPSTRQLLGTAVTPQRPLKFIQTRYSKICLPHLTHSSHRKHNKGSCPCFTFPTPAFPGQHQCFQCASRP